MAPLAGFHAVVAERCDPSAELQLLAGWLEEGLGERETKLTVDHLDSTIVIAYRNIVVLYWRIVDGELVCFPTGWRRQTYTAPCAARAHVITIRLAFDFVRNSRSSA